MTRVNQELFYKKVGQACQVARERRRITITQLEKLSGEQHKTIRSIESGRPHSLHHAVWMKNILGIDLNDIIRDMEGKDHGKENVNVRIEDFI